MLDKARSLKAERPIAITNIGTIFQTARGVDKLRSESGTVRREEIFNLVQSEGEKPSKNRGETPYMEKR